MNDAADILIRLKEACVGHPYAKIPWPHRLLHDAIAEIERLRAAQTTQTPQPALTLLETQLSPSKALEFIAVVSTNLEAIAHDGASLYVRFHGGSLYRYPTADRSLFDGLRQAESAGSFFHTHIKSKHKGEKVE